MQTFLDCIDAVKGELIYCMGYEILSNLIGSTGGTGFSAIKVTALGRPEILVVFSTSRNYLAMFFLFRSGCLTVSRRPGATIPR